MQKALAAYSGRDWVQAERRCRQVLRAKADHFDALTLLGIIAAQTQRMPEAAGLFRRAVAAQPGDVFAHIRCGNALEELARPGEALASYEQAIRLEPGFAEAYCNRGNALKALGRLGEALASYERAVELKPDYAEAFSNRGTVLQELRRPVEALASYEHAIRLEPGHAGTHYNFATALHELKKLADAVVSYNRAIELDPGYAGALNNLGNALKELGRPAEALASFERAIGLQPDHAEAHSNRGDVLEELKRPAEALASYERAMQLKPGLEYLYGARLHAKATLCDWSDIDAQTAELLARIERGEKASLPFPVLASSSSLRLQRRATEIWVNDKHPPRSESPGIPDRPRRGKIRIAYFSADFHDHATTYLMAGLLERHDRAKFEVFAFSFGPDKDDDMRKRVVAAVDEFIDVRSRPDGDIALLSRQKEIDIAVDLKGFTQDSRVDIFACRAAPLQVSYLGYPGTTAADYFDYLVADQTLIPEESRRHYSEKIVHLPGSYQVNDASRRISGRVFSRAELGLRESSFVFCCFNNNYKIKPATFDGWMRILGQVENSVLWLLEDSATATANLRKEAVRRGVAAERLVFALRMPLAEHLARHRAADLCIDTLPYGAHTTASDALWAGLPVLTCTAESFASRVAASLLNAVDLPELVAATQNEYEKLAIELATKPERLVGIRKRLAANRLVAGLFDTGRFARHIESAFTQMHERRLAGLAPDHIFVKA